MDKKKAHQMAGLKDSQVMMSQARQPMQAELQANGVVLVLCRHEPRLDSRLIAGRAGVRHKNLMKLIRDHKTHLQELGSLPFQTAARKRQGGGGVVDRFALLNEAQFDLLMRHIRGRDAQKINALKLAVTKAFSRQRAVQPLIASYLPTYHPLHDQVKVLAERHQQAGSQTPERMFHIGINRMINDAFGLQSGERDSLNGEQLAMLASAQRIATIALGEMLANGGEYSQAYQLAKDRVRQYVALLGEPVRRLAALAELQIGG
jgi:phage regulator Rha-like protein